MSPSLASLALQPAVATKEVLRVAAMEAELVEGSEALAPVPDVKSSSRTFVALAPHLCRFLAVQMKLTTSSCLTLSDGKISRIFSVKLVSLKNSKQNPTRV